MNANNVTTTCDTQSCGPGNDSVTAQQALSPTTPFNTLQVAVDTVLNTYGFVNTNNARPSFILANCTGAACLNYGGMQANASPVGGKGHSINISGSTASPTAVTILAPNGSSAIACSHFNIVHLNNLMIGDQGSALYGLWADEFCGIDLSNVTFNTFNNNAFLMFARGYSHMECALLYPAITISGSAAGLINMYHGAHFNCGASSPDTTPVASATIAIPNAVAWANAGIVASGNVSLINFGLNTFTGAGVAGTTGRRAILIGPGYLSAGGTSCNSVFPGNSACLITQGFQDDALDPQTTPLSVPNGGTGVATITGAIKGNGTGAFTPAACADLSDSGTACTQTYNASTWIPQISASGTAGTPAYTASTGTYEQFGREITARFNVILSGWSGSPSGNISISGLPFAMGNTVPNDVGVCVITRYTVSGLASLNYGITGVVSSNTSQLSLYSNSNTGSTPLTAAQTGTTPTLTGFCNYHT